jgi:H/ACA ribonucleoprotein complex subunit 1
MGPPAQVIECGSYIKPTENEFLCKLTIDKIPYFNAPIYLQNKQKVGKVEEILGRTCDVVSCFRLCE